MLETITNFIISVPLWVWLIFGGVAGWFIGDLVKKVSLPASAGTLWVIRYVDGAEDYYLEMNEEIPPDQIKTYSHLIFDVKMRKME